jgi:hypothetical protein
MQLGRALAGTALSLAVSGCAAASPSATSSIGASASSSASSSASWTPAGQATGTWTATGTMIEPGGWMATLLLDGRVLAAGGGSAGLSAELYDPDSGTWTATGAMIEGGQTATRLLDGRVLVTGAGSAGSSAELYDPDSGTWTATGSMIEVQLSHTATLLTDGRVLVAGGSRDDVSGNFANILDAAELYDPFSGTWTVTGNMISIRVAHFATLLRDGRVLVAGGRSVSDGDGGQLHTAELNNPLTGT